MKNKEKNAKEIIECAISGSGFSVDKDTGKISKCSSKVCTHCLFFTNIDKLCCELRKEWAEAEYIELKVFTEEEKALIRLLDEVKYIARDKNGNYFAYNYEPVKDEEQKIWRGDCIALYAMCSLKFDAIKWEDEKPTSREEILR